ncbi:MAG: AAA family ATPase, partial [Thermoleophilia bacterium]|nr:AAA family ATPase [Thermoleophilia bacterium]
TAMSEAADPEDVDRLLGDYHEAARRAIESHGGAVEKFVGDAVVGVFGVPAVHEDDPERAVRAGLRLLEALEGLTRPDGAVLEVRVGVNTGEALVRLDVGPSSGRGFLAGDAVNVAARLQAAAPPNGVVVGARTHDLTVRAIEYESLLPVAAKGKRDPVVAYRALRPWARTGLRTTGPTATPFLGRAAELAALHDALREASRVHAARFVLVVGEPGIGKSRLVLEFARALDERPELVTWRQGRCLPYGEGVTFWALGEIVKAQAGILDSDDVPTVEAKLDAAVPQDEEDRAWLLQRLRPLLGLEAPQAARAENFAAWTRFLESVASARPTVVVLEDLHWAGEAMLAFVEHLLSRELDAPFLLVATTRPELLQRRDGRLSAEGEDERLRRIALPILSPYESEALVRHLVAAEANTDLVADIVAMVGGNPLYAEQYVGMLQDRGHLGHTLADLRSAAHGEFPVPETVQAVVAARLDSLPREHKALLCDAAVLGETFWCGAVAALSGRTAGETDEIMAALADRDLVRSVAQPTMEGESEYLFWHALARDVAYGELPRKARSRKHEAAARWLEDQAGDRVDDLAEIIAHHYDVALDLALATGDTERSTLLAAPTIEALTRAGDRALRLDVAAAERHFARALALAGPGAAERSRLLPRWAETLLLRNRYREAVAACDEAAAGCRACGDTRGEAVATRWLADAAAFLNEPQWDLMRKAADLVVEDEPSREQVDVLAHFALSHLLTDRDPQVAIAVADQAIEGASSLGLPGPAMAISVRGLARLNLGDLSGLEDNARAIAAARAQGLGSDRATIEFNGADALFETGGPRVGYKAMVEVLEFARDHGLEAFVLTCRAGLLANLMWMGEWDRALAEIGDLVPLLEDAEDIWDVVFLRSVQAKMLVWRGDVDQASLFVDWLTAKGRETEIGWTRGRALLAASAVRCGLGDAASARSLLAECFDRPRVARGILDQVPHAARIALRAGDVDLAAAVARAAESELPESKLLLWQHAMTTAGALLAEADGQPEAAVGFAAAASGWRDFEMPYEEAQALLGQGRCLMALGRAPEAAPALAAARGIFARLKARPALEETETLLRGA